MHSTHQPDPRPRVRTPHLVLVLSLLPVLGCRSAQQPAEPESDQTPMDGEATDPPSPAGQEGMAGAGGEEPAAAMAALSCDSSVPEQISCGGNVCPAPNAYQRLLCIMPCCTEDDSCGIHGAVSGQAPTVCMQEQEGQGDARCPNDNFVDGSEGVGCCTESGDCGLIDPVFGLGCVERSMVVGVTLEPLRCDQA